MLFSFHKRICFQFLSTYMSSGETRVQEVIHKISYSAQAQMLNTADISSPFFLFQYRKSKVISSMLLESPTERTPIVLQLSLRSQIGLWEKIYYAPFDKLCTIFFWCGVYKYCCLVYGTVWCGDEVRSANCARTVIRIIQTVECSICKVMVHLVAVLELFLRQIFQSSHNR